MPQNRYTSALQHNFKRLADTPFCHLVGRDGEMTLTWSRLERDCRAHADACRLAGLGEGAVVLIFLRHVPELYGAFFGVMLGGFTPAFMPCTSPRQDPGLYWRSHNELMRHIRPAAIIADSATFEEMSAAGLDLCGAVAIAAETIAPSDAPFSPRDEPATGLLQHSSGTTGLKKGVALSFEAIIAQIDSYGQTLALGQSDAIVSWLPLYHDMGLIACCILPAYFGLTVTHVDPFHWLSKPEVLLQRLAADKGTLAWMPNFAFEHLAAIAGRKAAQFDLSQVRAFINCSEPCKPASFDRFAKAFAASGVRQAQLQCCYAMAETVFAVCQTDIGIPARRLRVDAASLERGQQPRVVAHDAVGVDLVETGAPIAGISIGVFDAARGALPEGRVGEIGLSGDFLFSGYNKDAARTDAQMSGGVFFSRDIGFLHDRRLYVLGRADDLIIVNGRNLYAHEVEAAVSAIAGVKAGRSVAVPQFDARVGSEALVVIAERQRGSDRTPALMQRDIIDHVLSLFNVAPRRVHIVEEGWLVKTTSGKISRKENQAKLEAERASVTAGTP